MTLSNCEATDSERFTYDGARLHSLRQINELPEDAKHTVYRHLLPLPVLER